jgi:hypothetical protein
MEKGNVLKIDTLGKGWNDKDEIMLHACFQLLRNFVEKESINDITDWNHSEVSKAAKKEIDFLYAWWNQRLIDEKKDGFLNDKRYTEDNEMLIRLIKIRMFLWT